MNKIQNILYKLDHSINTNQSVILIQYKTELSKFVEKVSLQNNVNYTHCFNTLRIYFY